MSGRQAIVFCVHHKPWLMMATLLTLAIQDREDTDLYFVYNLGDGRNQRESYREYERVAAQCGVNAQLSPFDERVRSVCRIHRDRVFELEYENDHALDSGVWYKFIREGRWRQYERVLFLGEGAILAHQHTLSALVEFAAKPNVHFVASGHEKRRIPREAALQFSKRGVAPSLLDRLHERSIAETYKIFARDPDFARVLDRWRSDFSAETQNHVPGVRMDRAWARRVRARLRRDRGSPHTEPAVALTARIGRAIPFVMDEWASRVSLAAGVSVGGLDGPPAAYFNGEPAVVPASDASETVRGVRFHREAGPEWFGCTVLHLLSRDYLARLAERMDRFALYDALDVPFAGSALEVIWGLQPAWLGFEKWFTDGLHRVRKHFATHQREDYPPEMAGYINRYHRGRLVVGWRGDYLKLKAWRRDLGDFRRILPAEYF